MNSARVRVFWQEEKVTWAGSDVAAVVICSKTEPKLSFGSKLVSHWLHHYIYFFGALDLCEA